MKKIVTAVVLGSLMAISQGVLALDASYCPTLDQIKVLSFINARAINQDDNTNGTFRFRVNTARQYEGHKLFSGTYKDWTLAVSGVKGKSIVEAEDNAKIAIDNISGTPFLAYGEGGLECRYPLDNSYSKDGNNYNNIPPSIIVSIDGGADTENLVAYPEGAVPVISN